MTKTQASEPGGPNHVAFWPSRTVRLAARALPAGAVRERYQAEFLAELHGMTSRAQTRHANEVLSRAWSLRTAVTSHGQLAGGTASGPEDEGEGARFDIMATKTSALPLLCQLNLHHHWRWHSTDDGARYRQCVRCDKDDYRTKGPLDQNGFGVGVSDIMGG